MPIIIDQHYVEAATKVAMETAHSQGDLLLQVFGLVLLAAGIAYGYWRWIRPHNDALDAQAKGLLLLVILMVMGGFIGSPFWWADEARSFSWDLPLLASRMLAAAGWSFVVIGVVVLERPTYRRLRLVLLLLFVYLVPLAVAAPLFHRDRFDPAAPITYAFFAIVVLMVISTGWYLLRQPPVFLDQAADRQRPSPGTRLWLLVVAIITGLWGLALITTDNGPSALIWVWPGDLLTSRLIGVMLLTIAAGALYSRPAKGTTRPMLAMILTYGLGLSLAGLSLVLIGKPIKVSYVLVFGLIFLVSALLLWDGRGTDDSRMDQS